MVTMEADIHMISPVVAFIVLTVIARIAQGSFFAPGAFYSMVWTFYIIIAMSVQEYRVYADGLWMIFVFTFIVFLGSTTVFLYTGTGKDAAPGPLQRPIDLEVFGRRVFYLICVFLFISVMGLLMQLSEIMKNGLDLMEVGSAMSQARYDENYVPPVTTRLLYYLSYPSALLGGLTFSLAQSRKQKILTLMPVFLATAYGAIHAMRFGIISSVFFWVSGYMALKVYQTHGRYNISKSFMHFLTAGFFLISVFVVLQWSRSGFSDFFESTTIENSKTLVSYLTGFTTWFHTYTVPEPTYGIYTFSGIYNLLGLHERELGTFTEMVYLDTAGTGAAVQTNIYTMYRGLMQDFSLPGALVFCYMLGVLAAVAYNKCSRGYFNNVPYLAIFYILTLASSVISITTHNSLTFGCVLAAAVWHYFAGSSPLKAG